MIAGHDHVRVAGRLGLEEVEAGDRAQGDHEAEAERRRRSGVPSSARHQPGRVSAAVTGPLLAIARDYLKSPRSGS